MGAAERAPRGVPVALAPGEYPAHQEGEAELSVQALALGELGARLGRPFDLVPVRALDGELADRGVQLDLRGQIAHLLRELQRLAVGLARPLVVGLGNLEVVAEGEQRAWMRVRASILLYMLQLDHRLQPERAASYLIN